MSTKIRRRICEAVNHTRLLTKLGFLCLPLALIGCAQGRVDLLNDQGKVVGNCTAEFNFHWYGAQDSVNYILYLCAREHLEKGLRLSDYSILENDYTLPAPPDGKVWSKRLAKEQFSDGKISEEKLGYVLASVEYAYWMKVQQAGEALAIGEITQTEYEKRVAAAKDAFEKG